MVLPSGATASGSINSFGRLVIDGTWQGSVTNQGEVDGSGSISSQLSSVQGTVRPGDGGPGILNVGTASFDNHSALDVILGGPTGGGPPVAGQDYSQLATAAGPILAGTLGYTESPTPPPVGSSLVIVANSGAPGHGSFKNTGSGVYLTVDNIVYQVERPGPGRSLVLIRRS
jgi:hypothetical protein